MQHKLFVLFLGLLFIGCYKSEEADLVVHNAKIYSIDVNNTIYKAMAIKNGKIIELGPERQIMNKYKAKTYYDARTRSIYPGFIDSHCHFLGYGLSLQKVNLVGTTSFDEVVQKLQEFHQKNPAIMWITGRGWDQNDWDVKTFPTNEKLNELFPETPVFIRRIDGHAGLANKKALELANITTNTKVEGGEIIKNNNQLTGILIDNAMELVNHVIPQPSTEQKIKALQQAEKNCIAAGLTTVDDAGLDLSDVNLIDSLHNAGILKIRYYAMLNPTEENYQHARKGIRKTDRLTVRSFKIYADGALGSRGAKLIHHYHDDHDNSGQLLADTNYFELWAKRCNELKYQMNTHCIGDGANHLLLNIYKKHLKTTNDKRWRIEHAQVVDEQDFKLFSEFNIVPSVQPTHATSDMYWAKDRLGKQRIENAYAYKKLLNQSGILPLGTDFPVEEIYPLNTFYAAVVRKDKKGFPEDGFQPKDALSREEALRGMTIFGALGNFEETEKGSLEVGKLADFVVLDNDLFTVPENIILKTSVLATFINGEKIFSK